MTDRKRRPPRSLAGGAWRVQRSSLVNGDGSKFRSPAFAMLIGCRQPCRAQCSRRISTSRQSPIRISAGISFTFQTHSSIPTSGTAPNSAHPIFASEKTASETIVWLNFDGINWKADVFLNGEKIGRIDGAFMRGRFDVTGKLRPGREECPCGTRRKERHARKLQTENLRERRTERRRARS